MNDKRFAISTKCQSSSVLSIRPICCFLSCWSSIHPLLVLKSAVISTDIPTAKNGSDAVVCPEENLPIPNGQERTALKLLYYASWFDGWGLGMCVCDSRKLPSAGQFILAFTTVVMCVFNPYWDLWLMGNGLHDFSREEHCPSHLGIFPLFLCLFLSLHFDFCQVDKPPSICLSY